MFQRVLIDDGVMESDKLVLVTLAADTGRHEVCWTDWLFRVSHGEVDDVRCDDSAEQLLPLVLQLATFAEQRELPGS